MSVQPLSPMRHSHLRWTRYTDYRFAAGRNVVALAAGEISKAALALPLAFVRQHEQWLLCAVLGLSPGQNVYVGVDGSWLASYVPAVFRAHPFHVGWEGEKATLCIDEGSGLLVEDGSGEPLFTAEGGLSEQVAQVWGFLSQTAESLLALEMACGVLAEAGVIEPWSITVTGADGERQVAGLHRIDELALNALDDSAFLALRRAGALPAAYAQLLSISNLANLGKLAQAHAQLQARTQAEAAERANAEVKPMIALPDDNTIDWDWSKIGKP